jgi:hypothetical protein
LLELKATVEQALVEDAERVIRMMRLREKVSVCLRTLAGAEDFAAIRSYLATAAEHGIGVPSCLTELI